MKRIIEERDSRDLEEIMEESLKKVGIDIPTDKSLLLLRVLLSGIAKYFYFNPDNMIRLGFLELRKNPEKEEVFAVNLIRSDKDKIVNADMLWRYYTGELMRSEQLKGILESFVNELLVYSQAKEANIANITKNISQEQLKRKGGNKNGVQKK